MAQALFASVDGSPFHCGRSIGINFYVNNSKSIAPIAQDAVVEFPAVEQAYWNNLTGHDVTNNDGHDWDHFYSYVIKDSLGNSWPELFVAYGFDFSGRRGNTREAIDTLSTNEDG